MTNTNEQPKIKALIWLAVVCIALVQMCELVLEFVSIARVKLHAVHLNALTERALAPLDQALYGTALLALTAFVLMVYFGCKISYSVRQQFTELQDARREAEAATRTKSQFLSNMSHEIRTPLTAIIGYAEELTHPNVSEEERKHAIHAIIRNGDHLSVIVNDILDLSKIEEGTLNIETKKCPTCEIVADAVSIINARAVRKKLRFDYQYLTNIPEYIHSDPVRIRQILLNLLGNAVKFTDEGRVQLLISLSERDGISQLQFDVQDTGTGIDPEHVSVLFQAFTQMDTSSTRNYGGAGLGLAISKSIAMQLGGDVQLLQTETGKGSIFRATVATGSLDGIEFVSDPMYATSIMVERPTSETAKLERLDGYRLLLAEDAPENQVLISRFLKKAGADVTLAHHGKAALEQAISAMKAGTPFDAILMDMQMPVMDGYEATSQLRASSYTGVIIALTANAMQGDRDKCIASGCDEYATKPVKGTSLIETIKHLVAKKKTHTAQSMQTHDHVPVYSI